MERRVRKSEPETFLTEKEKVIIPELFMTISELPSADQWKLVYFCKGLVAGHEFRMGSVKGN